MLCILRLTVQHIGTIGFMNHNSSCIWNISSVQLCMQNLCHRGQFPFDYLLVFLTVQKCYWWNVKWVSHKIYERRCMYNTPRGKHVWTISVGCMRGSRYVPRRDNFVFERGVLIFLSLKEVWILWRGPFSLSRFAQESNEYWRYSIQKYVQDMHCI